MYIQVAHDYDFLKDALKHTILVDDFTGRLWKIYQTIMDEGGPNQVKTVQIVCPNYKFAVGKFGHDEV